MKKNILLIVFIGLFCFQANAQSKGHLGKRALFNLDCTFSPSYFAPNFNGNSGFLNFNCRFEPGFEYIVGKKRTLSASYVYSKTQFNTTMDLFPHSILYPDLYIQGVGIHYKKYFDNLSTSYAPYGTYIMLSAYKLFYNYTSDIYNNGNGGTYAFQLELGYNYLLFDILRLTWSVAIGGTTSGCFIKMDEYETLELGLTPGSIDNFAQNRIFGTYFFGTKLGIGILAF